MYIQKSNYLIITLCALCFALANNILNSQCINNLTPGSAILDEGGQTLLSNWLPAGFEYEAELVYDSSVSGSLPSTVHNAVDGMTHTIVVGVSEQGNVIGGYNEGAWSSNNELLTGLDNNFLFSLTQEEKYNAIPGENHIWNRAGVGLCFGSGTPQGTSNIAGDLAFALSSSGSVICRNDLGNGYECPLSTDEECRLLLNEGQGWSGFTDRFSFDSWEVWQLKTSGNPVVITDCTVNTVEICDNGIDDDGDGLIDCDDSDCDFDNDGVCNDDEIEGCDNPLANNYNSAATDPGECTYDTECIGTLTPTSEILDEANQEYLSSWLPEDFQYQADLLYRHSDALNPSVDFFEACAGIPNTILVLKTNRPNFPGLYFTIGAYNEGVYDNNGELIYNLDNNFIFNSSIGIKYNALPDKVHLENSANGPNFRDFIVDLNSTNVSSSCSVYEELKSYDCLCFTSCPEPLTEGSSLNYIDWEVWALNSSGIAIGEQLCNNPGEICDNGIDDDGDGFIDCEDLDCSGEMICAVEICDNGIDDDGDGLIDCEDSDCSGDMACAVEICNNGIDDDGDGLIDCEDSDCDFDNDGVCNDDEIVGCQDALACNYNPLATDSGECDLPDGCTDVTALNYCADFLCDDGSCLYAGCTNPNASNYNPQADYDDGSCNDIPGCTNFLACNYNSVATLENNTCMYPNVCEVCSGETDGTGTALFIDSDSDGVCDAQEVLGCTDETACNFDPLATDDDSSCSFSAGNADAGPDLEYCQQFGNFGIFNPQGVIPNGSAGLWTVESGTASITIATDDNPSPQVLLNPGQSAVLRLTIYTPGQGITPCSAYDEMTVTNYQWPGYANAGEDQAQCQNGEFTLNATPVLAGEGLWTWDNPNVIIGDDIQPDTPVLNLPEGESVTLTWTVTNGTCTDSDQVTLTNYAAPTPAVAEDDFSFCGSFLFSLVGNVPEVGTGQWSVVEGPGSFNGFGTTVQGVLQDGLTTTYRYTITNGECSSFDEITVTNDQQPNANAGADILNACGTVVLGAEVPALGAGEWSGDHPNLSYSDVNNPNSILYDLNSGESATLVWTVTNGSCQDTDEVEVSIGIEGCTIPLASNYNSNAICDDGSCVYAEGCTNPAACNYDSTAVIDNESCILPDGCTDSEATNYVSSALCDDGSCEYPDVGLGCTDVNACNYDSSALTDNGTCTYNFGCTDTTAVNFNPLAECDDDSCNYAGCMDSSANNFNPAATVSDDSCQYSSGCVYNNASNYDPLALVDDGSCVISCFGDSNGDGIVSAADLTVFLSVFGNLCELELEIEE